MSIIKVPSKKAKKGHTYKVDFKYKECGITKPYTRSGFLTKKEAQKHENMVKAQINRDGYLKKDCDKSLNQVYEEWLKIDEKRYSKNTIRPYKYVYNKYIHSTLGKEKLVRLNYSKIQNFINHLNISYSTCTTIKKVLSCIYKFALKNNYIDNNPMIYVENTKTKEKKDTNNYLTFEEYKMIINKLNNGTFQDKAISIAISIGYHTGLRISEIFALEKSDFNFINNTITVNKQLDDSEEKQKEMRVKEKLKTASSDTVLPLVPGLKQIILEWFKVNPYENIICNKNGYYLRPSNAQSKAKGIATKLGVKDFHFHMLRHTFITNLYNNGVDVKTTQELARHGSINTTLNIYTHLENKSKSDTLNNVFEQIYSKNTPKMEKESLVS